MKKKARSHKLRQFDTSHGTPGPHPLDGIFVVLHEPVQHAICVISTVAFVDIYHKGMFLDGFGCDGDTNIDTGLEQWLYDIRVVELERKEPVLGHS